MLFWIFVIMIFLGIVIAVCGWDSLSDAPVMIGTSVSFIGLFASIICLLIIIDEHTGIIATMKAYEQRYESLVYQYENDIYGNDNDVGKRELMADIEKWNTDLAYKKEIQRDFWVGIFHPNIYDQFKFIELEKAAE